MKSSLTSLENHDEFLARHIGPSDADEMSMLQYLGFKQRVNLIDAVVPKISETMRRSLLVITL